MDLFDVIQQRHSVRAFLPEPLDRGVIERALEAANAAPSNCNVQPWRILIASGDALEAIRTELTDRVRRDVAPHPDFPPGDYAQVPEYRRRQIDCAVAMYNKLGVERGDTEGRALANLRNYLMFDAPHAAFFCMHKIFGATVAVDVGMAAQNFMLALTAMGVGSCPQGTLRYYPDVVRKAFGEPDETVVLFGVSFGMEDAAAPVNATDPGRNAVAENSSWIG
ncbi:MAG: nitroreductase [Gammaproteobacteria bacterium AqS3]|nr:nitroreductase [Gammaproteobacteria bacterium AqS3]